MQKFGFWTMTDTIYLSAFITMALVVIYSPEIALGMASVVLVSTISG